MAQQLSVNTADQFIGSKISLISKADIRYEGVLYALDLLEATISLAKVRSFGTEDRPTERPIPIKDEIYEFIIFRGSDIKSIDVIEPPKSGSKLTCGLPQDPAIIEVSHYQRRAMGHHNNCGMEHPMRFPSGRGGGEGVFDGLLRGGRGGQNQGQGGGRRRSIENQGDRRRNNDNVGRNNFNYSNGRRSRQDSNYRGGSGGGGPRAGRGNTPNRSQSNRGDRERPNRAQSEGRSQTRQRGIIQAQMPPKVTFEDHFDFEKGNEELKNAMEKLKIGDEEKKDGDATPGEKEEKKEDPVTYYDKDKFFDNISCEALEMNKGRQSRPDWRAERKLNAETFGLPWNPNQSNQRSGQRSYRMRNMGGGGYFRGGNNQMRYNNFNRYNNRMNYGSRGQQQ